MRAVVAGLAVFVLAGCSAAPGVTVTTTVAGSTSTGVPSTATTAPATTSPATTSPPETTPTTAAAASSTTRPDPPPRLRREVEVKRGPRTALYTLPADLLFDSGEAVLRPSSLVVVDEVARDIVERFPGRPIIVRGHTDSVGGSRANRELSRRRAEAVAAILVDHGGIGPIEIEAFGEIAPRASNETAAGRALNRRVEILVRTRR
jgi:outer membrane protein OmpA-like peptidoglycan-associated protein